MSFREKSAWGMGAVMLLTGLFWLWSVSGLPAEAPPLSLLGPLVPYVLAVVVLSIAVQVVLAASFPRDAERAADERERIILMKAGNWSGIVLAVAVIHAGMQYLWYGQGNVLFMWVIGGLIVAQIAEYVFQIVLFRRGA